MAAGIATIHVRPQRQKVTIIGMGRTNTGQKYIKQSIELSAAKTTDKNFKEELAAGIEQLLG